MQLLLTEPLFRGWHFTGKHAYNDARNMKNFCQSLIDPEMISITIMIALRKFQSRPA